MATAKKKTTRKSRKQSEKVIIRAYGSGVWYARLVSREGKEAVLTDARRIWRWFGANTLNEVATVGIDVARSKVSGPSDVTVTDVIEVIETTSKARAALDAAVWST
jgi:hypothetical protein